MRHNNTRLMMLGFSLILVLLALDTANALRPTHGSATTARTDSRQSGYGPAAHLLLFRGAIFASLALVFIGVRQTDRHARDSHRSVQQSEASYRLLFENNPQPMWVYHTQTLRFLHVNHAAVERYGYSRDEFRRMSIADIRTPQTVRELHEALAGAPERPVEQEIRSGLWKHRKKDGTLIDVDIHSCAAPFITTGSSGEARLVLAHDVTERRQHEAQIESYATVLEFQKRELEKANTELERLATLDGLTGLKNHRAFQERLADECERSQRYGSPLSLLMVDVDHFKQYNDTWGHPAGDAVLRKTGHIVQKITRDTDIAARYGGEEFSLILPHTDAEGAVLVAERLRQAIEESLWENGPITVSIGADTLRRHTDGPEALVTGADGALYASKRAGRNRVTHALHPSMLAAGKL